MIGKDRKTRGKEEDNKDHEREELEKSEIELEWEKGN